MAKPQRPKPGKPGSGPRDVPQKTGKGTVPGPYDKNARKSAPTIDVPRDRR